jgi:hypothetical protein
MLAWREDQSNAALVGTVSDKTVDCTYPAPQYVAFLPQYPFSEQQSPYELPSQVMLLVDVAPHDPDVLTSCPSSLDEQLPKAS